MDWSAESAERWAAYVRGLTGDEPQDVVGSKVGVNGSTIHRWRRGSAPGKPPEVAALAVRYGGNVLEAFVAAGYLTPEQANTPPKSLPDWASVTDDELLEQVSTRMRRTSGSPSSGLSAEADIPSLATAAHEHGSISAEQESRGEP
jgi:hypothetical protein